MCTLTNKLYNIQFVGLFLAVNLSCAMERSASIRATLVSKTAPQETTIGRHRSILSEAYVHDTVLQITLLSYTQCQQEWDESFQRRRIVTLSPNSLKCSSDERGAQKGAVMIGSLLTPLGIYLIAAREGEDVPQIGVWSLSLGVVLMLQIGWMIHCDQDSKVTEEDMGRYTERKRGKAYHCGWEPLQNVNVGVMLASGVVLRASTNEEGAAYLDLAGADSEDIAKMTLYVPKYAIIDPIELDKKARKLLAFALLPKQNVKLAPGVYSEIKLKARHAAISCYQSEFTDNPVGGTIIVSVEVASSGRVRRLSGDFDPGSLSAVNGCLWDKLASLQFEPWQGEALAMRVPVSFEAHPPPPSHPRSERDASTFVERVARATPALVPPLAPNKKVETILVGGMPVVFVHDPSLGCTAGVAACQAAIAQSGGCQLVRRETSRAVGGLWGVVAGAMTGAMCEQKIQEICAKAVCGD